LKNVFEPGAEIRRARPIEPPPPDAPPPTAPLVVRRMRRRIWPAIADLASNEVYVLASAIAFNALLSFFPFVILLLVLCRNILQWPAGYTGILQLLQEDYLPINQDFIVTNLRAVVETKYREAATLSLLSLAFTSSGLFAPIEMALNRAWGVSVHRSFVRGRFIALSLVVGCGALALGSVYIATYNQDVLHAWLGAFADFAPVRVLSTIAIRIIIFPITVAIFFLVYYILPNRRIYVREVLPVAIFTGLLWEASKYLFIWLAPRLGFRDIYGPFYLSVTLVTWAYISASILLLGANLSANRSNESSPSSVVSSQ
jgi:membrane protein/epoxyqueuosine reductase